VIPLHYKSMSNHLTNTRHREFMALTAINSRIRLKRLSSSFLAIYFMLINSAACLAAVPKSSSTTTPSIGTFKHLPRPQLTKPLAPPPMPHRTLKAPTRDTQNNYSPSKKIPAPAKPLHIKKGSKKVRLFKSTLSFSAHPTDLELNTARVFIIPLTPMHTSSVAGENEALAKALISYKEKTDPDDVSDLTQFIENYPKSRWRASIELNLGRKRFETGYLTDALANWKSAWELAKKETNLQQRIIADEAITDYLSLNQRLGNKSELKSVLANIAKTNLVPSVRSKMLNVHAGLATMEKRPEISFKCGPYALESLLSSIAGKPVYHAPVFKENSTDKGTNLARLKDLSDELGLHYQVAKRSSGAAFIVPAVMHWKLDHFAAITAKIGDRYRTADPTFFPAGNFSLSSKALESQTDGYFLVPDGPLPTGWQKVSEAEARTVWGKGLSSYWQYKSGYQPKQPAGPQGPSCGLATASAYSMHGQLNIQDTPLTYTPPIGPKMDFLINYDYATDYTVSNYQFPNFGTSASDWTFNWVSYISLDGSSNATVVLRGGGSEYYAAGSTSHDLYSYAQLTNISSGVYQRQLPDGTIELFNQADGTGRIFLTQITDPQGGTFPPINGQ